MVKKILRIVLWALTGAALVVLFVFGRKWYLETPLKGVRFDLERHHPTGFVEHDSVVGYMEALCNLEGQTPLHRIKLREVQQYLNNNPWVEQSGAYIGLNDTLIIHAKEYEPVLRVFNQNTQSVYVTAEGMLLPSSEHYTPRMLLASGQFDFNVLKHRCPVSDSLYLGSGIQEALHIALAIQRDPFLNSCIGLIHRNSRNEYELMVNNLDARVVLGDTCLVDTKLARLRTLLEKYLGTEELNGYKTLNLRYKNQIVCTK
jgi:cell division protein FtsQ